MVVVEDADGGGGELRPVDSSVATRKSAGGATVFTIESITTGPSSFDTHVFCLMAAGSGAKTSLGRSTRTLDPRHAIAAFPEGAKTSLGRSTRTLAVRTSAFRAVTGAGVNTSRGKSASVTTGREGTSASSGNPFQAHSS